MRHIVKPSAVLALLASLTLTLICPAAAAQGPILLRRPVVDLEQIGDQSQLRVAALPQPFFTSSMVRRR